MYVGLQKNYKPHAYGIETRYQSTKATNPAKKELKTTATKRGPVPSSGEPFERESQKREVLVRTNLLDGLQLLR